MSVGRIRGRKAVAIRRAILTREPLCRHCLTQGRVTAAQEVDHIIPLEEGGTNELANQQPLCIDCHFKKTNGRERQTIGIDGWPVGKEKNIFQNPRGG